MKITEELARSLSTSEEVYRSAMVHVSKRRYSKLFQNTESTLFFGTCHVGRDEVHYPSCYFIDSSGPVYHCTCSKADYPCEHVVGMMVCISRGDERYSGPAPLAALCRFDTRPLESLFRNVDHDRITPILEGLMEVHEFIRWILRKGLLAVNHEKVDEMEQLSSSMKDLGIHKLSGLLQSFAEAIRGPEGGPNLQMRIISDSSVCEICMDLLFQIQSCIEHNRDFLQVLYTGEPHVGYSISQFLNHPWIDWNTDLLRQCGLAIEDAQLIQLGFYSNGKAHQPASASEPQGFWAVKGIPEIFITSSVKSPRRDDSAAADAEWKSSRLQTHNEVVMPELAFVVPGYMNHGISWEKFRSRYMLPEDLLALRGRSHIHWEPLLEQARRTWLEPGGERHPVALLLFEKLLSVDGELFIESSQGERLLLTDGYTTHAESPLNILRYLPFELRERQSLLVAFHLLEKPQRLAARPMAVVTENEVLKLVS